MILMKKLKVSDDSGVFELKVGKDGMVKKMKKVGVSIENIRQTKR